MKSAGAGAGRRRYKGVGNPHGGYVVQVNRNEIAAVFAALGVGGQSGTAADLTKKLNVKGGIAAHRKPGHRFVDPAVEALFAQVAAAQKRGVLVRVADAAPEPAPKPAAKPSPVKAAKVVRAKPVKAAAGRPVGKGKSPPAKSDRKFWRDDGRPTADAPLSVWREYRVGHPATLTGKGAGIAKAVFDRLAAAGKGKAPKPVTKADLHAFLVEKYPDRDAAGLLTNLNNLIPTRFRNVYRLFVWTAPTPAGKGYYVAGDGKTPQPKAGVSK